MNIEKEQVINRMKEAKEYGLKNSTLARGIGLTPTSIYMFVNGTYNLAKNKQLEALCYIESYIEQVRKQLKQLEKRGIKIDEYNW